MRADFDVIINIIIIAALAVTGVISSYRKSKKEGAKAAENANKREKGEYELDSPWQSIEQEFKKMQKRAAEADLATEHESIQTDYDTIQSIDVGSYEIPVGSEIEAGDVTTSENDQIFDFSYDSYDKASMKEIEERRKGYEKSIKQIQAGIPAHSFTADLTLGSGIAEGEIGETRQVIELEEFNLRDAIIYSEILKPKYKDL